MNLLPVTGSIRSSSDVLTLSELKDFLVDVPGSGEDTELQQAIDSAFEDLEEHTGRAFGSRQYDLILNSFPSGSLCIPKPPLISVDSFTYTDSADATQTLTEGTHFTVHGVNVTGLNNLDEYGGYIKPVVSWPSDVKDGDEVVTVRFTAGYASPNTVPALAKRAVKIRSGKYLSFKGDSYNPQADKLYWETIQTLIVHSYV